MPLPPEPMPTCAKSNNAVSLESVDSSAKALAAARASKTFVVTPWLDYWQGVTRRLPSATLQTAMEERWANSEWRQAALKSEDGSIGLDSSMDYHAGGELLHMAQPSTKVCHPHLIDGIAALGSASHSEFDCSECDSGLNSAHLKLLDQEKAVRHGFIQCVLKAWNNHLPLVLKPDHIWVLILQAIARHVNSDPVGLRNRLLSQRNRDLGKKIDLGVDVDRLFSPESTDHEIDYAILVCEFQKLMERHLSLVANGAASTHFSTTTDSEALVMKLTMMDMCKQYFDYWTDGRCGFPAVTLAGELSDWESLCGRAEEIINLLCHTEFARKWISALLPTLERFVSAYHGEVDAKFWNAMIKRGGNLRDYYPLCGYSGWFHVFFPGREDGEFSEWCVPYDVSRNYVQEGLREAWDAGGSLDSEDSEDYPHVRSCDQFPSGFAKVPVKATHCSKLSDLEMHAGFVGYTQDDGSGALMPLLSWYIATTSENEGNGIARRPTFGDGNYAIASIPRGPESEYPEYWLLDGSDSTALQIVPIAEADSEWRTLSACLVVEHPEWLGQGKDYRPQNNRGSSYNHLKLKMAWRVENAALWKKYKAELEKMDADLCQRKIEACESTKCGALRYELPGELQKMVGESLLLHGTSSTNILAILRDGFNERLSCRQCFGAGNYFADDAGNADQYVDPIGETWYDSKSELHKLLYHDNDLWHPGDVHYMMLCRVALGCAALSTDGSETVDGSPVWAKGNRGSKLRDLAEIPGSDPPLRYHSLVIQKQPFDETKAKSKGKGASRRVWRYPEYITSHSDRCYPEYILAIQRVKE
eukprot:TRINITY_DN43835_c0_g1_i1.p1 TRINITY_DN43835_c0_g1~~TRINITY_DN43835_c0_g1_i1.p1  ORF type:complete len:815 (-),score=124.38 TRINITY_DN43835_c0_g1_i1:106-2550(-)